MTALPGRAPMNAADVFNSLWTDTMNRCAPVRLCALALALLVPSLAQAQRQFPEKALRGQLEIVQVPDIRLNGEPGRLSPGARIRNTQNLIVVPNTLLGQQLTVNYVRELNGLVHEVWILTPEEAKLERAHEGVIRNYRFSSEQ